MDFTGLYYSEEIQFKETSSFDPNVFNTGTVFYEVLKISDGTALFLDDHLERLQYSLNLAGYAYFHISVPVIHYLLRNLIRKNNTANGNVKILLHFLTDRPPAIYTFFVPHYYPTAEMYAHGVTTALYKAERQDPNIKVIHPEMILHLNAFIKSKGIYDALLVDHDEKVTEGSRTNVFFIQGDNLVTPPSDRVLKGITRTKIFILCKELNIKLLEQPISSLSLDKFEGAFFSGTSPKILPINQVDAVSYRVEHPITRRLIKAYDDLAAAYLDNN